MLNCILKRNIGRPLSRWDWSVGVCTVLTICLSGLAHAQTCSYSPSAAGFLGAGGGYQNFCGYSDPGGYLCFPQSVLSSSPPGLPRLAVVSEGSCPLTQNQCTGDGLPLCARQVVTNSSCGTYDETLTAGVGDAFIVSLGGINTPGCNVPSSVPNGIGGAATSTNPQGTVSEPISTGNGNYYYQHTDLSVPDHRAALPLAFQRSYNSLDTYAGPLGNNWTHNFNITVATTMSGGNTTGAVVKWGDGHGEVFTLNGSTYVAAPGVTNTLARDAITYAYTLTSKGGVQYFFSWDGLLQSIQDTDGLSITTIRDSNNNLTAVIEGQQQLLFSYDANNRLSQVADLSGRTVSFSYDTNGNLVSATDPAGSVTQ
jgi:YD repeat-containing protein